jgi:hypothetical protein
MSKKLKMLFGISVILTLIFILPSYSEANWRGHGSSRNHSRNYHSGFRIGVRIGLPVVSYARPVTSYRYNSPYYSNNHIYNVYRSETQVLWQRGYDDGYRQGYYDAERHSSRYSTKVFSYDRKYSYDRSYRQGYETGYSNGFRDSLDLRRYGNPRIY